MEIDEREERPTLSPPLKKRRSPSPDGGAAEGVPKRRKHHHRHRHHRHHHCHRHSKKDEGDVNEERVIDDEMAKGVPYVNVMVEDGELEEGEILEDGEIEPESNNLAFFGEDRIYSDKELKALACDSDALQTENAHNLMNHKSLVMHSKIPNWKIEAVPRLNGANLTKGKSLMMVGESEVSENSHTQKIASMDEDNDVGTGDFRNQARLVSPFSRENVYEMKYKDGEGDDKITPDHSLGRHRNSEDMIYSPSHKSHQIEVCYRDQSRSHDTGCNRSNANDRRDRHKVRSGPSDAEMDNGCMETEMSIFRCQNGLEDRYVDNDGGKDKDSGVHKRRERSASYNRYDRLESRYTDRDRERNVASEHRSGRHRSSSVSSRHGRDGERRERDRRNVRDRDMENLRDVSGERYKERDGLRDVMRERERHRYGYDREKGRIRDQELNLDTDREPGRQFDRDRANSQVKQRDSRYSKCDEWGQHRDRTKSKELGKESISARHDLQGKKGEPLREEDEENYEERIEQQLAKQEEEDLDKIKEESRKRRQVILEKYKQQQQKHGESSSDNYPEGDEESMHEDGLWEQDSKKSFGQALMGDSDVKQDSSDSYVADSLFTVAKSLILCGTVAPERNGGAEGLDEGTPEGETSMDMFCDDIFGESPVGIQKKGKGDCPKIERSSLHDNWDDADGYYSYRFGEVLDGRYEVIAGHGKGVFSNVVRAKDLKAGKGEPREVAIKIIRNNHQMLKAGHDELNLLRVLAAGDREDRRHCVRFLSSFKYRNHLCLIFESLHMNLREVLKKFGRNIGLALTAVRTYAKQLFVALKHLKSCGVLHCDVKPDNMLVNEGKNVLKLCDFGNAMLIGKQEPTPYLVSRFYRAPEIILGLDYDYPLDMWSVGCCLYELYAGSVLFPGKSNNEMLRFHMELKGPFPKKMLRKGLFTSEHFDQDLNFQATEKDPVTGKVVRRLLLNIKPKDISTLISSSPGEDPKMVASFKDLLERIFILDPEKRLTVSQALSHPFITGK